VCAATAVAAGAAHTCAILGGSVSCWGANDEGQLGNAATTAAPTATPATVTGLSAAVALAAGGAHTCALLQAGTVACWGADTSGQLGDGVALTDSTPALARIACD